MSRNRRKSNNGIIYSDQNGYTDGYDDVFAIELLPESNNNTSYLSDTDEVIVVMEESSYSHPPNQLPWFNSEQRLENSDYSALDSPTNTSSSVGNQFFTFDATNSSDGNSPRSSLHFHERNSAYNNSSPIYSRSPSSGGYMSRSNSNTIVNNSKRKRNMYHQSVSPSQHSGSFKKFLKNFGSPPKTYKSSKKKQRKLSTNSRNSNKSHSKHKTKSKKKSDNKKNNNKQSGDWFDKEEIVKISYSYEENAIIDIMM